MKKAIWLVLLIVTVGLLAACNSPQSSGEAGANNVSASKEEVENFPEKSITILVHTSAGGPTDLMAREIAKAVEPILGQKVLVENRPGGSGATQMAGIQSAKADGYTLGAMTPSQIGLIEGTLKDQYKLDDFSWISRTQIDPYVIVVNKKSPFNTLEELIEFAKENPGELKIGGYGAVGSGHNVAWNILAEKAGIEATWAAYESTGDAVTAILGNHIDVANSNPGQVSQYVESGDLKVLGVMNDERLEDLPEVPTYKELGYDVDTSWTQFRGIFGPAGIDPAIQKKLSDAFAEAMETEGYKEYMKKTQMVQGSMNNEEYTEYIAKQSELTKEWYERLGVE
ncbi:tripartite tricarboxylate transporter substrate binding protein [Planomicrobium sp. CPCC 101079]|uniref:tripartite tricarboxylate transporter substrate binding protein n=1 Tax=Planomicrobium sp. CPCC 101079 TaxID=2599618 RepID=UPI0011B4A81D|nr:tripartite tricarboxylate transporter substrate binding protein [Planomicrobium sp. CPCC 101079]TWT01841.1 tripartite tricarboxylate transporter substrate binding protein [Planomicrobium sp. CPCC 101079]